MGSCHCSLEVWIRVAHQGGAADGDQSPPAAFLRIAARPPQHRRGADAGKSSQRVGDCEDGHGYHLRPAPGQLPICGPLPATRNLQGRGVTWDWGGGG